MSSQQQAPTEPLSPGIRNDDENEKTRNIPVKEMERLLDEALDETFPASDAISSMRFTPGN
ncbi:hypothetical protein QN224_13840 [Sinorhizobium sp. 8-89]|uniref:hypothetical protein n=1 Tax=Sinorhizobium sp. 7-81 TaxID=3049087 RepID=UPI0024C25C6C|nr:hypothetical protein [Sinorhizobium sp. 7-81]MDK1386488.1 hypothetical protein [Sinorhizobium sp. 7-81]